MWLEIISLALLVISSLITSIYFIFFTTVPYYIKIVFLIIGISAIIHVGSRDYYLGFLGHTAFPCESMQEKTPANADRQVVIKTQLPNRNVVFWASEKSDEVHDHPLKAYAKWSNSGVTRTDSNGLAILRFRTPSQYKVPYKPGSRPLRPHVHYRVCGERGGLLGRVETTYV
jgi:hypothetical protein